MKTWMVVGVMIMFSSLITGTTTTGSDVKWGCLDRCGNISVPYPFGIDDSSCAVNSSFLLHCNSSKSPPQLIFGENIPVLNISVENGTMITSVETAYKCYTKLGELIVSSNRSIDLGFGPFRFSDTRNKLTVFGCDTMALMYDNDFNFGSGCVSLCGDPDPLNFTEGGQDSCSGIGCCQTSIPKSLKTLNIVLGSVDNHTDVWEFNPCDYAFIADNMTFDISHLKLSDGPDKIRASDVVIEWVIEEKTCDEAIQNSTYACTTDAECYHSGNGKGYRCRCLPGFEGNPYLPSVQGCQNIDECKDPIKYPCEGTCKDTIGNYTCTCPFGMHGDGKTGCRGFRITTIVTVTGAITLSVVMGLSIMYAWKLKRKQMNFSKNGGMVLKRQGIVRLMEEAELAKATKNYDNCNLLGEGGFAYVYKGVLSDNTSVAVKIPKENKHSQVMKAMEKIKINEEFEQEIAIVSRVKHKNVVTLFGLCVETKVPLLVYEFISNGTLYQHIHGMSSNILNTWKNRLRIAAETALALDYLHSLVDPPIIHGDVKSKNILLDENYKAKVSDFGASVLLSSVASVGTLPGDETAKEIRGTFGYLDPEYMSTGILTEKSDVYSFGIVLIELLTGKKPGYPIVTLDNNKIDITRYFLSLMKDNGLIEAVSFEVANEDEKEEIQEVAWIAERCISYSGIERPTMKQISEELDRLGKSRDNWRVEQSSEFEETQLLLRPSFISLSEHPTMPTFDIEHNIHTV